MTLAEPTVQNSITILRGIEHSFESHHGVSIYDSALVAAVELSDRYIKNRKLPDKAINIVDQAAAKVKIAMTSLPDSLSEMQITANQLHIEKNSLLQERDETQSALLKKEYEGKLIMIDKEISDLVTLYEKKKNQRTTLKTLFDKNQTLKKSLEDLEAQVKIYEAKSDLEKVSELRYGAILTIQKEILTNKDQIAQIQKESGFVIKDSVEKEDIAQVVSEQTGIPLTKMLQ
jgi:ATP-dependent Clp protease ATP-binding subunit ClpB